MRMLGIVLLIATLLFGCSVCIAADEPSKPGAQALFDNLSSAYQPFKSCVDQKLRSSGKSRRMIYSEIAASDAMQQVLRYEKKFLGAPSADVLASTKSEHVRLAIEALEQAAPYATEKSYMYRAFGVRRQIAGTSIIASSPSIRCEQPRELGYWVQEEDDFEALTNLWTFSKPFMECEEKHTDSFNGRGQVLASAIVRAGKLPELKRISSNYLGRSDGYVMRANRSDLEDVTRVRVLIEGLVQFGKGQSESKSYRDKTLRIMALLSLQRITASATQSKCVPSAGSIHWIEEIDKRRSQQ
jgi:hypothetical protein